MIFRISNKALAGALLASVWPAMAQLPVITSFSRNGSLVCSNLGTGTMASVEWASAPGGPWHTNWAGLDVVAVGTNGTLQAGVPMFYRVRGLPNLPPNARAGMSLIPVGAFSMGNSIGDPDITDAVTTSTALNEFYMDTNLVSYAQWLGIYNYATNHGYGFAHSGAGKAANHPVQGVDWFDAVKWNNARSQQMGLTPVYYTDAGLTQVFTNGEPTNVFANWAINSYRLPTEAEWEKAARGGLSGKRYPWGNTIAETQANYYGDVSAVYDLGPNGYNTNFAVGVVPYTSPVGSFATNGYGLTDMAGNVWQWCWDWYGANYAGGNNPRGAAAGSYRVLRGGYWGYYGRNCRTAFRFDFDPKTGDYGFGFRSVLPTGQGLDTD